MHDYPGFSPDASQSDYFEICILLYIHMTLIVSNSESAYLFIYKTLGTKSLGTFLISVNLFTLCKQQNKYSYMDFFNAKFGISILVYLY